MQTITTYEAWFTYYHYNTGAANNGTYSGRRRFDTLEEAVAFKWKIESYINGTMSEGAKAELEDEYLGGRCEGFFKSFDGITKITSIHEKVG